MMAVIFEVEPAAGAMQDYLDLAASLREELGRIDGFISIERFESLTQEGKILSLSFWRDEEAIQRWRTLEAHRAAQVRGRRSIFCQLSPARGRGCARLWLERAPPGAQGQPRCARCMMSAHEMRLAERPC